MKADVKDIFFPPRRGKQFLPPAHLAAAGTSTPVDPATLTGISRARCDRDLICIRSYGNRDPFETLKALRHWCWPSSYLRLGSLLLYLVMRGGLACSSSLALAGPCDLLRLTPDLCVSIGNRSGFPAT